MGSRTRRPADNNSCIAECSSLAHVVIPGRSKFFRIAYIWRRARRHRVQSARSPPSGSTAPLRAGPARPKAPTQTRDGGGRGVRGAQHDERLRSYQGRRTASVPPPVIRRAVCSRPLCRHLDRKLAHAPAPFSTNSQTGSLHLGSRHSVISHGAMTRWPLTALSRTGGMMSDPDVTTGPKVDPDLHRQIL